MPNYKVIDADKFDADLKTLADGIRNKTNISHSLSFPSEMSEAIRNRGAKLIPKVITSNGDYTPEREGADGYSPLSVVVPDENESYFSDELTELNLRNITSIADSVCKQHFTLKRVNAPNVTKVGNSAFFDCRLNSVNMSKLEEIGEQAFYSNPNYNLFSNGLPDSVRVIGNSAFDGCTGLELTTLPKQLEYIGDEAFDRCSRVKISEIPMGVDHIGSKAFYNIGDILTFKGTPSYISPTAFSNTGSNNYSEVISVPWDEGFVEGAPWGASNATINYNNFRETTLAKTWRFKDNLNMRLVGGYTWIRIEVPFVCGGIHYDFIDIDNEAVSFGNNSGDDYIDVYDGEWLDEAYKTITIDANTSWDGMSGYNYDDEGNVPLFICALWLIGNAE